MPLWDLNRRIFLVLKDLEDSDDEILFGSDWKSLSELVKEESELIQELEALYLLQLDNLNFT